MWRSEYGEHVIAVDNKNRGLPPAPLPRRPGGNQAIQSHVMAKAETPFQFDEQDAAVAVIAPYAYGEKPEEVEVRLDDHRVRLVSPCCEPLRRAASGRWDRSQRHGRRVVAVRRRWGVPRAFSGVALPRGQR